MQEFYIVTHLCDKEEVIKAMDAFKDFKVDVKVIFDDDVFYEKEIECMKMNKDAVIIDVFENKNIFKKIFVSIYKDTDEFIDKMVRFNENEYMYYGYEGERLKILFEDIRKMQRNEKIELFDMYEDIKKKVANGQLQNLIKIV
jgi:hypothetical protein